MNLLFPTRKVGFQLDGKKQALLRLFGTKVKDEFQRKNTKGSVEKGSKVATKSYNKVSDQSYTRRKKSGVYSVLRYLKHRLKNLFLDIIYKTETLHYKQNV